MIPRDTRNASRVSCSGTIVPNAFKGRFWGCVSFFLLGDGCAILKIYVSLASYRPAGVDAETESGILWVSIFNCLLYSSHQPISNKQASPCHERIIEKVLFCKGVKLTARSKLVVKRLVSFVFNLVTYILKSYYKQHIFQKWGHV
jgi:hypothetical protein